MSRAGAARTNCEVNALVEATPISGPVCVAAVPLASRAIMDPMTLQTAKCIGIDEGIAIAEFAPGVHFNGKAGQALDHDFPAKPACQLLRKKPAISLKTKHRPRLLSSFVVAPRAP
jgi:hypothetical protein